jgi:hypothetical protein
MPKNHETPDERAERLIRELKAATSGAAGVLSDLRAAIRDGRELIPTLGRESAQRALDERLPRMYEQLTETMKAAENRIVDVFNADQRRLEDIANVLMSRASVGTIETWAGSAFVNAAGDVRLIRTNEQTTDSPESPE